MLVEHPVALARADKNSKKDIPWISVSAVGMFLGSPTDIQRIGPMPEIDIFWTSTGLTCVMWESVDSGKMSVPSVATDRNGQTFMSRQARGITMIEYMSRQAGDHPLSGRRDNSCMPRRPHAGVAPAQLGPTPVASTSTSASAALGLHHLRMVKTSALTILFNFVIKGGQPPPNSFVVTQVWPAAKTSPSTQ
jgi:hypothetical protein